MNGQRRLFSKSRAVLGAAAVTALAGALASCGSSSGSTAGGTSDCATGDYPTKPIELIVPYEAGGGTDTVIRPFAVALEKALGSSVVVVNKPGGGGVVGTTDAANAAPDGYTVGVPIDSLLTVQPKLNDDVSFDLESFTNIRVSEIPQTVVVGADQPYKTMKEYLAAAEKSPGKIRYGVPGVATDNDLMGHALELAADADLKSIAFAGGGAESLRSVLRGGVESSVIIYPTVKGSVESGDLRVLGVLDDEKLEALPDVPSLKELDLKSEHVTPTGMSLSVPTKAPKDVVDVLDCGAEEALKDPKLLKEWEAQGIKVAYTNPADTQDVLSKQRKSMTDLVGEFPELQK